MRKDYSKCKASEGCQVCGHCFLNCEDDECRENCADVCPNGALIKEE